MLNDNDLDGPLPFLILILVVVGGFFLIRALIKQARQQAEKARRRAEQARLRREEFERNKSELDSERNRRLNPAVPPDIARSIREFQAGDFAGEERSPLAYVGYRVGKTNGLPEPARHRRLDFCFALDIPTDLAAKYVTTWGRPLTYRRYAAIVNHLKMLADQRNGRRNFETAVSHWLTDARWFSDKHKSFAERLRQYGHSG
jgi:hypothetical protein